MNTSERFAYDTLKSVFGDNVVFRSKKLEIGENVFEVKKAYNRTVWLYPDKLRELQEKNIPLLVVKGKDLIVIPAEYLQNREVYGIKIKVIDKIRIELSEKTVRRLSKYGTDYDSVINMLLDYREGISTPVSGLPSEFLPLIYAIMVVKQNRFYAVDAMNRLLRGDKAIDKEVLEELIKFKLVYKDFYETKPLSWFKVEIDDKVKIKVFYKLDFCRLYCSNIGKCKLFKENLDNKDAIFVNEFEFDISEFKDKSVEELVGKCIVQCVQPQLY